MLDSICDKLTALLLSRKLICKEESEIYNYGFQVIITNVASILSVLIIALITQKLLISAVYLLIFILSRRTTGGYHADTPLACTLIFIGISFITIMSVDCLKTFSITLLLLVFIYSAVITLFFCPLNNENKSVETVKRKRLKLTGLLLTTFLCAASVVLLHVDTTITIEISKAITLTSFLVSDLVIVGYFKEYIKIRRTNWIEEIWKNIKAFGNFQQKSCFEIVKVSFTVWLLSAQRTKKP